MQCFNKGLEELRDGGDGASGVGAAGTCSGPPGLWASPLLRLQGRAIALHPHCSPTLQQQLSTALAKATNGFFDLLLTLIS